MLNFKQKQYFLYQEEKHVLIPSDKIFISSHYNGRLFQEAIKAIQESGAKIIDINGDSFTIRFYHSLERLYGYFKNENGLRRYNIVPMYYLENQLKNKEEEPSVGINEDFIVKFNSANINFINKRLREYDAAIVRSLFEKENIFLVRYFGEDMQKVFDLPNLLMEEGLAKYAHPNFELRLYPNSPIPILPTDSLFKEQWALEDNGLFGSSNNDINIASAWNLMNTHPNIQNQTKIAILDDGLKCDHLEFKNRLENGYNIFSTEFDNLYWPSLCLQTTPTGQDNHGTAIASIISANADNVGLVGVAPLCKLMPIKMRYTGSTTTIAGIVDAVDKAILKGVKVINISWSTRSPTIYQAIEDILNIAIHQHDITICCAAGNYTDNTNTTINFPGNLSSVITVAACDHNGQWINLTNTTAGIQNNQPIDNPFGSCIGTSVDICAPGIIIRALGTSSSSTPLSEYFFFAGTSAATAFVSGVASLLYALVPQISPMEVKEIIQKTADSSIQVNNSPLSSNVIDKTPYIGSGRINAGEAILATIKEFGLTSIIS